MEEQEDPTTDYIKGFNEGYRMSKVDPEVIDSIVATQPSTENDFLKGLLQGKKQYDLEQELVRNELIEWERKMKINPSVNQNDRSKDLDY
ncbi:hypothetical protein LXM25_05685 [Dyadobacter sp. LJ53]|uniref:hypothetical protein n=1 Tax=Dyadobacter chenwenxiniae TaxID=2906456 RepID=UPI001F4551D0|nr:hypothetical protein [Dyadobacter chenwenxiniae]MCF0049534.1 hypothetical protein [Dyadobacter chenwenxiniae]